MLKEEVGSSVCLSVPWLIFLTRHLQKGRDGHVEARSEPCDETYKYSRPVIYI